MAGQDTGRHIPSPLSRDLQQIFTALHAATRPIHAGLGDRKYGISIISQVQDILTPMKQADSKFACNLHQAVQCVLSPEWLPRVVVSSPLSFICVCIKWGQHPVHPGQWLLVMLLSTHSLDTTVHTIDRYALKVTTKFRGSFHKIW